MSSFHRLLAVALVLGSLVLLPGTARAAQSYDSCAGFIDSVPVTISKQGVWCLRKDVSTNITSGNAITIAANNVTIDCNDFKIGGLAAGDSSEANGIYVYARQNAIVRHCNVRGFYHGIYSSYGAGHLVEDNRFDNNLFAGIYLLSDNGVVRRNLVYDTGGAPGEIVAFGIYATADVTDNTVEGVFATGAYASSYGIFFRGTGRVVRNNRVRGLVTKGDGDAGGIYSSDAQTTIDGNQVISATSITGTGIRGRSSYCRNNTVVGFSTATSDCQDVGGNAGY